MYAVPFLPFLCILMTLSKGVEIIPKEPYIELGSDIKMMVKSEGTSDSHGRIYWTLNNLTINESFYETINSTFAAVSVRNFTLQKATLQCHSHNGQILAGTYINSYSNPSNISCIKYITKNKLTCTWEHNSPWEVNYKVYSRCIGVSKIEGSCHTVNLACTIHGRRMLECNYSITVTATTKDWTASSSYLMDPCHRIKLDPPENVKAKPIQLSSRLAAEWDRPEKLLIKDYLKCQVKYAQHVDNTIMYDNILIGKLTTKEVEPCTNHSISVRCALSKAPWSEWSQEATVLSLLNVSAVQLWRKIGAPDVRGARTVSFMLKGISSSCKFIYGCRLGVFLDGRPKPITLLNTTEDKLSVTVGKEAYRITLALFRGDTTYPEQSIYIPATGKSLLRVQAVQASSLRSDLLVSWVHPDWTVSGYMVDWTTPGATHTWMYTRDTNISLTGLQPFKRYIVTVTPLFHDKTGLENSVEVCSSERGTEVITSLESVVACPAPGNIFLNEVNAQDKSARLSWTMVSERECNGTVVNFTVFYKTGTDGPFLSETVNGDKKEFHLEHLQPSMQYSVYVRASGVSGATDSTVTLFSTDRYGPAFIHVLIIGGVLGIIAVLVTGLCCVIQWMRFLGKVVPDPGLSSLVLWSTESCQQKRIFPTPLMGPICDAGEGDRIYVYDVDTSMSTTGQTSLGDGEDKGVEDQELTNERTAGEQSFSCGGRVLSESEPRGERLPPDAAPANLPGPDPPIVRDRPSSPGPDPPIRPSSPYRNQGPVEGSAAGGGETSSSNEDSRPLLEGKQHSKAGPFPAYVTVNMIKQGSEK